MKKSKLIVTLFIAIAFVFAGFSAYATGDEQITQENEATRLYEMEELRTLSGKAYAMSDGAITYELYAANIHYKDETGQLKEINSSIINVDGAKNGGYKYKNAENSWDVYFADNTNNEMIKMAKGEHEIEISFITDKGKAIAKKNTEINKSKSELHEKYFEDTSAVFYEDIKSDIDIAYSVREGYVKEDIILNSIPSSNTFEFIINANKLDIVLKNNKLEFTDKKTKEVIFASQKLIMYDSASGASDKLSMNLELVDSNKYKLTIIADEDFLKNSDTVYPVVIDPTIIMDGGDVVKDTYVSSTHPTIPYYSSDYLRTGNDGAGSLGVRRTFIQFDVPSTINNKIIYQANLEMLVRWYDGSITTRAYMITEDNWDVTETVWDDQPETTALYRSDPCTFFPYSGTGTDWLTMDVKAIVGKWADGSNNNNGFMVMDDVENDPDVWATMYSNNYGTTYKHPRLTITYYPTTVDYTREVIGVYGGNFSDNDMHIFCNELTGLSPAYVDARYSYLDSDPERLVEAREYDVLYWSGHGYYDSGSAWLSYGLQTDSDTPSAGDNYTFDACEYVGNDWMSGYTNIRSNSQLDLDLKYAFFASCNIVRSGLLDQWKKVMSGYPNRIRIIHGYNGTAPSGTDDDIARDYFDYATYMSSINAWLRANLDYSEPGTAIAHYPNRNDCLVGFGSSAGNPSTTTAVDVRFYDTDDYSVSKSTSTSKTVSSENDLFKVIISAELKDTEIDESYSMLAGSITKEIVDSSAKLFPDKETTIKTLNDGTTNIHISDIEFNDGDYANYEESLKIANAYIQELLGVKEGNTILDSVKEIRMNDGKITTPVAYSFRYKNSINDISVSTLYSNNFVNVIVDNTGIIDVNIKWDNFSMGKKESVVLKDSEDALNLVIKDMKRYEDYYAILDPLEISDVKLVYSSNNTEDGSYRLVWEFVIKNNTSIQVDVCNQKVFNPFNPK